MIPIRLSIQGLYSYQDLQEIDFRYLIGSSVFGIFGKVGSGKTSLLEAISFALYGKTERLNSQDNLKYNMMNLKSKQMLIDFEFQAGPDQQLYRFVYEARRHPKRHQEISTGERRMFIWQGNNWQPIGNEKEDVGVLSKQILGLDYENFKRTIIIPQNQFREFLELSPTDRTKMMNQLFKLEQYDLAGRAGKLAKANDEKLSELRGLLAPLETVTPEAIEQARADIIDLTKALEQQSHTIQQLQTDEQQLLQAQKQSEALATARRELDTLLSHEADYEQIRKQIAQYELCRLEFQADLAAQDRLFEKQSQLADDEQKARGRLKIVSEQLPRLRADYDAAKLAYENRDQLQQQINELDSVQTIRTLQETVLLQMANQKKLVADLERQRSSIDAQKTERIRHQTIIDQFAGQESTLVRLYDVRNWFTAFRPLKKQADDLQEQLMAYDKTVEDIKARKDTALAGFRPEWAELTLKTLPAQIEEGLASLKAIKQEREKAYDQAKVQAELRKYADALTDGKPCPVCGSEHHPARHRLATDEADLITTRAALRKVEQRIDDTQTLQLTIAQLAQELRSTLDNGKRLVQERTDIVRQLTAHEDTFVWPEFSKDQEQAITEAIRQESDNQNQLQQAQKIVRELTRQIEEAGESYQAQEKKISEIDAALAGLNGQIQSEVESLAYYRLEEVVEWDLSQIADLRESLTRTYSQAKTAFDEADQRKSEAETRLATTQEQIQQLTNQQVSVAIETKALEQKIAQKLAGHGLNLNEVERILERELDVETEKRRIRDFDAKLGGLRKQIADLATELVQTPYDPVTLGLIQKQLTDLKARKDSLNKDLGRIDNVLTTLESQLIQKQTYQQQYDECELRRQDLKKMDELFRAQGFVNYVSSVYLKNLCESANDRFFKLTNNHLKLELDEKNNFQVRDFLNGGEVRSVKTLSGGQTFQAALALALALSDNIQHLTKARQNLFFLDEGFGTLDKDSLQTVFKTLKALRSENRVVGIISHVEELQQEVDTFIRAEVSPTGSRIVRSWEI